MKKLLFVLTLFFSLSVVGQIQPFQFQKKDVVAPIIMVQHKPQPKYIGPISVNKSLLFAYKPKKLPFKFTLKTGANPMKMFSSDVTDDVNWREYFDNINLINAAKYDARLKFYVSKRSRITLRTLYNNKSSMYFVSWTYKF